ncbi:3-oxoacyl-ACP synthase III, partial [Brevibacterium paucivorans]
GFVEGGIAAGKKALAEAGIEAQQIGLMINASVTRANLEPSVAVSIHDGIGLPSSAMNFDIANACLGFVNAMAVAATMIESGAIEYALVVA